ncbi:MAG: MerR family transcriptional regulator [Clostridia bacterium]|nr:MerR family transcriptional regulator [Clostridia bacterium]
MSKYTTGEIAKLCDVSVRTVQYYDSRKILVPSELSEGGRRLYSEDDLKRMKIICFLRDVGLPINSIKELLQEKDPASVIDILLAQQQNILKQELDERQQKLDTLNNIKKELKGIDNFSVETIGDIAHIMNAKKKLRKIRWTMLLTGLPISILQWGSIVLWALEGIWWPFVVWAVIAIPWAVIITRYYFKNVSYICPQCHEIFKPKFKEAFWASHTPTTRKLTCPKCGHKGHCVETCEE